MAVPAVGASRRAIGVCCANEAEFQGYYVISAADPEVLSGRLCQLPPEVLNDRRMQRALRVLGASAYACPHRKTA